ncbi:MAG TPA: hypothetical protein DCP32_04050 [Anaerolineaceae bacterium]|nr:MAG: hypothetical protein A2X24_08620 [Chloroflexi bacterium GWB2_54_36]HAL15938.1 hypothetical protein [Anaerolineaceae bacterium]
MNTDPAPPRPDAEISPRIGTQIDLRARPGQRLSLEVQAGPRRAVRVLSRGPTGWRAALRSERLYAGFGLLLAAAVLLLGLTRFPAQVTPDEVYPSLRAVELIWNGFKGEDGVLLPAFLRGSTPYGLGTGVYLQVLPQLFRPNTLTWIRACNVLLGLLAGLLLAAWLRFGLRLRHSWVLLPLIAGMPAWFYFSRTGLDIALAASLLIAALGCYGFYRSGRLGFIYGAVVLAMLAFYAAPAARLAVPTAVLLLTLLDWQYHHSHWRLVRRAQILTAALCLPLIIFLLRHPDGMLQELAASGSYLVSNISNWQKVGQFFLALLNTVNPIAWLVADPNLPVVYRMGPYPPFPLLLAPFTIWGGWLAIQRFHRHEYRLLWIGLLSAGVGAAPFGGKLPHLLFAAPLLAAFAVIGLHAGLEWLTHRWQKMPGWLPAPALLLAAGGGSLILLFNALTGSRNWLQDYGREGLQFGAPQIYGTAQAYAKSHPDRSVLVWPEWSTDPDALRRFFAPYHLEWIQNGFLDPFLYRRDPAIGQYAFLLPADKYEQIQSSGKFDIVPIESIPYPNGQPAFALVELAYSPQFERILAQESAERRALVTGEVQLGNEPVTVRVSALDIGVPANLFDNSRVSLVRTAAANPLVVELIFPQPRYLRGVLLLLGAEPINVTAILNPGTGGKPLIYSLQTKASDTMKEAQVDFDGAYLVSSLRLEVLDEEAGEPAHVHLWEIQLVEPLE